MTVKAVDKWQATDVFEIGDARYQGTEEGGDPFDPAEHDLTYDEERSGVNGYNAPAFSFEAQEGFEKAPGSSKPLPYFVTKYMVLPVKRV